MTAAADKAALYQTVPLKEIIVLRGDHTPESAEAILDRLGPGHLIISIPAETDLTIESLDEGQMRAAGWQRIPEASP